MTEQRFLVVDDEPDVEELVRQKFRHEIRKGQFEILFAQDGVEALEIIEKEGHVDIVFTDINMPRMDGLSLLAALQDKEGAPTTIVVSAYSDQKNIRTAMNNGAFDFLTKPIDFEDWTATLLKARRHNDQIKVLQNDRVQAERNETLLRRYFSPSIAHAIAKEEDALSVQGERSEATFLFTDLQGFSPLTESCTPQTLVVTLSAYFDQMVGIVFDHKGTLMQIVGDAMQVTFGALEHDPAHAQNAVACALALDEFAQKFSAKMRADEIPLGKTRIGVNTGKAVIGRFGGAHFFNFSVYGFDVILAARLESANKVLGTRVCVSEKTVAQCPDFQGRPVGDLLLRGASDAVRSYEPFVPDPKNEAFVAAYQNAFELLEQKDPEARQVFANLVSRYPDDPLASLHLSRLLTNQDGTVIEA